ncbi:kinase-like domain-containing protein [Hypoxylon sp. NC0597]|nr:kinase-like domain-containing protein [Hypoxylon sp. NC0597]
MSDHPEEPGQPEKQPEKLLEQQPEDSKHSGNSDDSDDSDDGSSSPDSSDEDVFGPLMETNKAAIVSLAVRIRNRVLRKQTLEAKYVSTRIGEYNIIHIVQLDDDKFVFKIPVCGWGDAMTPTAEDSIESEVCTMRLIEGRTSIPVPRVYACDKSVESVLGAPFICMSFMPGTPLREVWFEEPKGMSREEFRLNVLRNTAKIMAQCAAFSFDQIGSISLDEKTPLAPCYEWQEDEFGVQYVISSGPFDSSTAFLEEDAEEPRLDTLSKAERKIMASVMPSFPISRSSNGFVLCPPDFDAQNVLVDEQGNITGWLDWEHVHTVPRPVGYAKYPSWIMSDWDPVMGGWPGIPEDSPDELKRYREYYKEELGKELGFEGDWKYTDKSHITTAVWFAAQYRPARLDVCQKLVAAALEIDSSDAMKLLYDIGTDKYGEEEWNILDGKLKKLMRL